MRSGGQPGGEMVRGVLASVGASALFAVLFYYATLMDSLSGAEIFGWRMLFNAPCLTVLLVLNRQWPLVRDTLGRMRRRPGVAVGVVACAAIVAAQLWLFVWAPVNGRALEASLGFFLMPLFMVLVGWVVFRERISRMQLAATALAAVGVGNEVIRVGGISWVTAFIAMGYPVYFMLRRRLRTDHQGGVWIEMHLIVPLAAALILGGSGTATMLDEHPRMLLLIPGLGVISAVALSGYYLASQLLPFGLFGLLAYLEPVLLVFVALLLGESIAPDQWLTYIPIWGAVAVLFAEGVWRVRGQRRLRRVAALRVAGRIP
jgi:chloramphenicol-sensitive protein RarD